VRNDRQASNINACKPQDAVSVRICNCDGQQSLINKTGQLWNRFRKWISPRYGTEESELQRTKLKATLWYSDLLLVKTPSQQRVHTMTFKIISGSEHHEIKIHLIFVYFKISQSAIDPRPRRKLQMLLRQKFANVSTTQCPRKIYCKRNSLVRSRKGTDISARPTPLNPDRCFADTCDRVHLNSNAVLIMKKILIKVSLVCSTIQTWLYHVIGL
jgi:hypothetical protein